jgi:phosphoserine phosphatase RsbU/P
MLQMSGSAREIALDLRHRNGSLVPVLVNAVADRDADGAVASIQVAAFPASHRREYERELLRAKHRAEASEVRAQTLARTLQQTLIPPVPPEIPGLDVSAHYRPAGDGTEVGGDFYDIFRVSEDEWVVDIGDVCGKGVEAAVVTSLARHTLRAAAMERVSPASSLRMLNRVLLRSASNRFCTVVVARLRVVDGAWEVLVSRAGHPPPIVRTADGSLRTMEGRGTLLGVIADPEVHDVPLVLAPGDALVLYTDGLSEGRDGQQLYGDERIRALLSGARGDSAAALGTSLLDDVIDFQHGDARDDIAIVVIRAALDVLAVR